MNVMQKKELNDYLNNLKKKHNLKECFALNADCSENIIQAHSIQNNRILKRISKDGLILYFGKGDIDRENMQPKQFGRKTTSTFTGFCGYHDQRIFKPIDDFDYEQGNEEQEYLFSYKALAKEYHTKACALFVANEILEKKELPNFDYETYYWYMVGTNRSYDQLSRMRIAFNKNLERKRFYKIFTKRIVFDEVYPLAVSSMISLSTDFQGNKINDLANMKKDILPIFVTIFPQKNKTHILIQCLKKEINIFNKLFKQFDQPLNDLKPKLSMLLLTYCENMAISPFHWDKLSKNQQNLFVSGFLESTLDYTEIQNYKKYEQCNLFNT